MTYYEILSHLITKSTKCTMIQDLLESLVKQNFVKMELNLKQNWNIMKSKYTILTLLKYTN
jgi:hypothetical protein